MTHTELLLAVSHVGQAPPEHPIVIVCDAEGGTIGRGEHCRWTLPDPARLVSAEHAVIGFADGEYRLVDVSSNGVFVGEERRRLPRGEAHVVAHGDLFHLGEYRLRARLVVAPPA